MPLALRSPRKEEDEGKKHSPHYTSSKRAAPRAAQQRLGAPSKPIFKQIASACQFSSPSRSTSPEVWPQSSALRAQLASRRLPCPCGAHPAQARDPASPWELGPSTPPPDRWELGTLQLSQRPRPEAGSTRGVILGSHLPGQQAGELAREQSSQKQPAAPLCSALEQTRELTCPPASPASGPTLCLAGRGWRFPPCRRKLRDSVSLSPTTGSSQRAAHSHSAWETFPSPRAGGECLLAWQQLPASALQKHPPPPLPSALQPHTSVSTTFPNLLLPTAGFTALWGAPPHRLPWI